MEMKDIEALENEVSNLQTEAISSHEYNTAFEIIGKSLDLNLRLIKIIKDLTKSKSDEETFEDCIFTINETVNIQSDRGFCTGGIGKIDNIYSNCIMVAGQRFSRKAPYNALEPPYAYYLEKISKENLTNNRCNVFDIDVEAGEEVNVVDSNKYVCFTGKVVGVTRLEIIVKNYKNGIDYNFSTTPPFRMQHNTAKEFFLAKKNKEK